jgi:hypothetical protein
MVACAFYLRDDRVRGDNLIGVLPERRKDSTRINRESIMRWGKMVLGDSDDCKKIYFVQVCLV